MIKRSKYPLGIILSGGATLAAVLVSTATLESQPMQSGARLALALLPLPFSLWPLMLLLWVPSLFYAYWRYR